MNNVNVGAEYYLHGPRIHEYFKEMNAQLSQYDDIMTVGEIANPVTVEDAKSIPKQDERRNWE